MQHDAADRLRLHNSTPALLIIGMLLIMGLPFNDAIQLSTGTPPNSPETFRHHRSNINDSRRITTTARRASEAWRRAPALETAAASVPREVVAGEDSSDPMLCETESRQCVIVGGGIAGLAAARDLEQAGLDFVLLEGGGRLGGRIHTYDESPAEKGSRPLELGAQWLHGTVNNPLFDFCVEEGVFDSDEGRSNLVLGQHPHISGKFQARMADGTLVSKKEFKRVLKAWSRAVLDAEKVGAASIAEGAKQQVAATTTHHTNAITKVQNPETTTTRTVSSNGLEVVSRENRVGQYVTQRVQEILLEGSGGGGGGKQRYPPEKGGKHIVEPHAGVMGFLERRQCTVEGCDDLYGVSLEGYGAYEELDGGDVRVPGGFSRIVDALAQKIPRDKMRLNCRVSAVQWACDEGPGGDILRGGVNAGGGGGVGGRDRAYHCAVEYQTTDLDGAVCSQGIECNYVVVTVGLGVLKNGSAITFSPPLPMAKLAAIDRLGFGTADKVFVRCSHEDHSIRTVPNESGAQKNANPVRTGPQASFNVGVLRPMSESSVDGLDDDVSGQKREQWLNDVYSFTAEGEHVYSWLTGPSARVVERVPALQVQEGLLSLLRDVTKDASWRAEGEPWRAGDIVASAGVIATSSGDKSQQPRMRETAPAIVPSNGEEMHADGAAAVAKTGDGLENSLASKASVFRKTGGAGGALEAGGDINPSNAASVPPSLVRSTWNSNPLFRGSYSYIATGSSPADIEELARPLTSLGVSSNGGDSAGGGDEDGGGRGEPRVFFAGEATHTAFFSTAHGGFESGRRAAEAVLRWSSRE